jgi:hypothetical protein
MNCAVNEARSIKGKLHTKIKVKILKNSLKCFLGAIKLKMRKYASLISYLLEGR